MPSGMLSTAGITKLEKLRDVNAAAKADQYALVWDNATSKHVYIAVATSAELSAVTANYSRRQSVIARVDNTAAPPTEVSGDRYLLDDTGASHANWDGSAANSIVEFNGTTWDETPPVEGYVVYNDTDNMDWLYIDDGTPGWSSRAVAVVDHGGLTGLADDDHTQYLLGDGTRAGTGLQEFLGLNLTDSTELTISSGAVTVTQGYHTIDTEGDASSDDLDTVTVAGGEGDILILRPESSARTVVIKHATGNIQCVEEYDITMDDDYDFAVLIRKDGSNWMAWSGSRKMPDFLDNGDTLGGALAGDIYYHDGTTVTNLRIGTVGQHLEVAGGLPSWEDAAGGGDLSATDIDTLAELNAIVTDATLIDTGDSRLSDARTPTAHNHAASEINSGTLAHERGGIEADISGVAVGDVLAGTGTGTMALVTSSGHSDGDVLTIQADGTVDFETPAGGGGGVPFDDDVDHFQNSADNTKTVRIGALHVATTKNVTLYPVATGITVDSSFLLYRHDAFGSAPGAGHDIEDGYTNGSTVNDYGNGVFYMCVDGNAAVADWRPVMMNAGIATLTDGPTVTIDANKVASQKVTLGGNRTIAFSNFRTGQRVCVRLTQDGTGSRTVTWPSSGVTINWAGGSAPTLTTTANKADWITVLCIDDTGGSEVYDAWVEAANV